MAGAIVRRGGASIQSESDDIIRSRGAIPTGQVAGSSLRFLLLSFFPSFVISI